MKIQIEHEITAEEISDMFCGMIEGNDMVRSWCHGLFLKHTDQPKPADSNLVWYGHECIFEKAWIIECHYDDPERADISRFLINPNNFADGLKLMAKDCKDHWSDLVNENADAITYDVLLQCVVLKGVIYG